MRSKASKRGVVVLLSLTLTVAGCADPTPANPAKPSEAPAKSVDFSALEKRYDARVGVYAIDTGDGKVVANRPDERFPYASTHKVFSASAVLAKATDARLGQIVRYRPSDIVSASPITKQHIATGMTLRDLMDAALRYSDNTAGNMLFREIGGPSGLTKFLRAHGDSTTHVDRIEPDLNEALPGDVRDTSTPHAFAEDLRAVALGDALPGPRRALLNDMMRRNTTGAHTIRAGAPSDWSVADKTGSGERAVRNDIAILTPPKRAPIVLVVFTQRHTGDTDDALLAEATKTVLESLKSP